MRTEERLGGLGQALQGHVRTLRRLSAELGAGKVWKQNMRCAGVGRLGGICTAAGCQRHPAKESAGQARCHSAENRRGCCTPACQSHTGPANHAGGGVGLHIDAVCNPVFMFEEDCTSRSAQRQLSHEVHPEPLAYQG